MDYGPGRRRVVPTIGVVAIGKPSESCKAAAMRENDAAHAANASSNATKHASQAHTLSSGMGTQPKSAD